jgi:SnoaL-like domain
MDTYTEHKAIETLVMNYGWAIDSKDWPLLRECFTEDCRVSYGNGHSPHPGGARRFEGRDELVDYLASTHQPLDGSLHTLSNLAITIDSADSVAVRVYVRILLVMRSHPSGALYESAGYYRDKLTRDGGQWRIRERDYTRVWASGNTSIIRR